ncbi:probable LRR receptor-like serine/threonine-protein kinase At2g16250 isoform X2 [Magnolia sinica]|uniref:probable LRR receptor-like serine/threonine-protein kinase At2g16250 isoform X2 n=1 Tax=Magnolia sinica TaxID=86752 RepID=UPI0026585FEC|nr:probable LRR receptor-like serine/threonine-protein kinase At2g16250 isoform X2 [Magnolia sinica]
MMMMMMIPMIMTMAARLHKVSLSRSLTTFSLSLSLFFFFLLLLLQSSFAQQQQQQPPVISSSIELSALYSLRSSLGLRSRDWPRKTNPCSSWIGISCRADGRVVAINLSSLRRTRLGRLNPDFSVDALSNLTFLDSFNSTRFPLPGPIPSWFGSQSLPSLRVLDLRSSSISSSIPSSLGTLPSLTHLYLSGNALTGNIPDSLGQLSNLSVLDLSQNSLVGPVPSTLSYLSSLVLLNLSVNFLSGPIPSSIGALSNLRSLVLSNNSLTGSIPTQIGNLSLLIELDLSFNSLMGELPTDLGALRNLQRMALGNNALTGTLPGNFFSSLASLQLLDVSYNNLTGTLPNLTSNANASTIATASFNLSHNLFYGSLPPQLWSFSFIDLSNNYFEGRVPDWNGLNASYNVNCLQNSSNQRSLIDCTSFYAARGLNFDGFGGPNTTQPPTPSTPGHKNNRHLKFILAGVFGGLGFIALLVLIVVLCMCQRGRGTTTDQREVSADTITSGGGLAPLGISINFSSLGEAFTYEQLLRATVNFGDVNLIKHGHSGDLYRGILDGGIPVVVKRIDMRTFKKDAFMVELDMFSKASHTRLVPLLGHCLEHENEKLLVYKYMPNGDLSNALYKKTSQEDDGLQSLDWITRLKIAIGAAEALTYLHHECAPPLVHRTSEHGLSGSPSATCAYDVYCLGKVLLELVTGKLGISGSNDASTNEWLEYVLPYINVYERELVTKIVDPSLIVDEDLLEEVWAMAVVAKSCLNPKPSKRPLTRYILKALENPLKVVREETSNSARLRTTSSRGSWNAAIFGSWRHSSSDIVAIPGPNREGSSLKQSGTVGSQGSGQGGGEVSSSHKRLSKEIFPEPSVTEDVERPDDD